MGRNTQAEKQWSVRCLGCGARLLARVAYEEKSLSRANVLAVHLCLEKRCAAGYAELGRGVIFAGVRLVQPTVRVVRDDGEHAVLGVTWDGIEVELDRFARRSEAAQMADLIWGLTPLRDLSGGWRG